MSNHQHGFILTRQWREQADGYRLIYWLYTAAGPRQVVITQQQAVCFFHTEHSEEIRTRLANTAGWEIKPLQLKSFYNKPVSGLYFNTQKLLQHCRDLWPQQGLPLWEADIRTVDRYLSERFIAGDVEVVQANCTSAQTLVNPLLRASDRQPIELLCASVDIETDMKGSQVYSIAVHGFKHGKPDVKTIFMVGKPQPSEGLDIQWFDSEKNLLHNFLAWFQELDPDVLIGWNVVNFDLRFLQKRCDQLKMRFGLGRLSETVEWRSARDEQNHYFALVPGRVVLDGIDTLKAATWNFESFSLEFVSQQLLGRGKLIDDVENRGHNITELFHNDKIALARYNLEDCVLVSEIFEKAHLLSFSIERSRLTGLPMDKVGGSVAAFENLYLPKLHRAGFVAPNIGDIQTDIEAPGGYVMQSRPGLYEHVLVLDFKSLYPSIIRTFCIDPLSLLKGRFESDMDETAPEIYQRDIDTTDAHNQQANSTAQSDWVPGFNGAVFSKQHHLLPDIIERLWQARDQAKKAHDAPLSQAIKIIMNSFYGVLGTPLCRFFDPRLSSSITLRGHDIMRQTRRLIENQGHKVIYGDTDSVFVWLEQAKSPQEATQTGQQLAADLNAWWQTCLQQRFGLTSHLEIEFETHYQRFFMPTMRGSDAGSKKRYAGLTVKDELIFKGLENVRTDWTQLARQVQYEVCWRMFHDQNPTDYLKDIVQKLYAGELDEQLWYRKRIRRRLADYQKNVPPHVQAARKADAYLQQQGQAAQYARGGWINYVITVVGPEPAENHVSPLDYEHYFSRQLAPAVDGLLYCMGTSLDQIQQSQLSLF